MEKQNKTKAYTIKAVNNYNAKFDRIMASFPLGTKERITRLTGQSANKYITGVVLADLERLESGNRSADGEPRRNNPQAAESRTTATIRELGEKIKANRRQIQETGNQADNDIIEL